MELTEGQAKIGLAAGAGATLGEGPAPDAVRGHHWWAVIPGGMVPLRCRPGVGGVLPIPFAR